MSKKSLLQYVLPLVAVAVPAQAMAGNVGAADARRAASDFIRQCVATSQGRAAKSLTSGDLTLTHAEASQAVAGANDYYAFGLSSGGWVVVAGDDRARPVLAYSDRGTLDFGHLPCAAQALLDGYKREMEYLLAIPDTHLVPAAPPASREAAAVEPLVTTAWGQEMPYNLLCPVYQNQACRVGCVATAMAQVMNYWNYPESCRAIPSYLCLTLFTTLETLPATTFDYSLMLDSYCHWDWESSTLVQDAYTDAQAQAVAKLSRYCGQAVQMRYGRKSSAAYTSRQLNAMVDYFGYRPSARLLQRGGILSGGYTNAEWETLIKAELDARRPVLYTATDNNGAGRHAFVCDGYRSDGLFHFNMGWYGNCNGWYATTALDMDHHDGMELRFASGHEMIVGLEPPEGWTPPSHLQPGDVDGDGMVDVTDLNTIINIMLGGNADGYSGNANIDGQGGIDIDDINRLINIMLAKQLAVRQAHQAPGAAEL